MNNIKPWDHGPWSVCGKGRFFRHTDGSPFFWLADTAWLLFTRTTREEARLYLKDRRVKGFNVIQIMIIHHPESANAYGKRPFIEGNFTAPDLNQEETNGSFWDYADEVITMAEEEGLYVALVPVWGGVVKGGALDADSARNYGQWLAARYQKHPHILWLIGGDIKGSIRTDVWESLACAIREVSPNQPMTFHPFGRTQSSTWFHYKDWLDFNMFQSGHRRYDQLKGEDPAAWIGEDNWRYVQADYDKEPAKPTLDGEPSYEGIPHGLHDANEPLWEAKDARRYAYWSVFAGACGHTYGHNAVMQFYNPDIGRPGAYGCTLSWTEALDADGAAQMVYLKNLMLSRPYFERIPDPTLIHGNPGQRYDYVISTRGDSCLMIYTYSGRPFELNMGSISGTEVTGWWFNPRSGESEYIGAFQNTGISSFDPPGQQVEGNDWVLILDDASKQYDAPGIVQT
ncbi:glycoside hydrolase family 140 protein [Paenibacillus lemnae]|uniref:DUF4038 domain-containing protein n=1 Tax=Paenibacillus lemnae TaxID=1330551 RepID=A0A848MCY0_PAELE|nr:glycoside hydrolase family 140 protein [Paenibacillus lemnae]NMO98041.1 DUF4038 domain-containing protein [Paenibacillus lemnae]